MSSTTPLALDPEINRTLTYWFAGPPPNPIKRWFQGGPTVDEEIRSQFLPLVTKARASELSSWKASPKGTLALLILLDQFPRNLFRGSPESYSSDPMALEIATEAIANGYDRELELLEQTFFYLPLMHDENLISQVAGVALFENLLTRCGDDEAKNFVKSGLEFGKRHLICVQKFGRFPSRNGCLGRETTKEEIEWLKEYPSGF